MCTQCVNVFARKGVVPPAIKVRKQTEVDALPDAHGADRLRARALVLRRGPHLLRAGRARGHATSSSSSFALFHAFSARAWCARRSGPCPAVAPGAGGAAVPLRLPAVPARAVQAADGIAHGAQGNPQGLRHRRHPAAHRPAAEDRHAAPARPRTRRSTSPSRTATSSRPRLHPEEEGSHRHHAGARGDHHRGAARAGARDAAAHPEAAGRRAGRAASCITAESASSRWCSCRPPRPSTGCSAGRPAPTSSSRRDVELDADSITPLRAESVLMEGFRMVDEWPVIKQEDQPATT